MEMRLALGVGMWMLDMIDPKFCCGIIDMVDPKFSFGMIDMMIAPKFSFEKISTIDLKFRY